VIQEYVPVGLRPWDENGVQFKCERHEADAVVLGRRLDAEHGRSPNAELSAFEVDIGPTKRNEFSHAQAGVEGGREHRLPRLTFRVPDKLICFDWREEVEGGRRRLEPFDPWYVLKLPPLRRAGQHATQDAEGVVYGLWMQPFIHETRGESIDGEGTDSVETE
jgi:hypothetical protein